MPESVLMMFGMLLTILIGTAIIIVIVVNLRELEKKEHTGSGKAGSYVGSRSDGSYSSGYLGGPRNLRAIADYKRNHMMEMEALYEEKMQELAALELKKDEIDKKEYEFRYLYLLERIAERKRYLEQAREEWHAAEMEAPL